MFRLLRYFSIASLISMVLAAIVLGTLHQLFEKSHLLRFGESRNIALAQAFSTNNWPHFRSFAKTAKLLDADTLRLQPDIAGLDKSVREAVRNTPTLRVRIFHSTGAHCSRRMPPRSAPTLAEALVFFRQEQGSRKANSPTTTRSAHSTENS